MKKDRIFLFIIFIAPLILIMLYILAIKQENKENLNYTNMEESNLLCNYSSLGYHINKTITCCGSMMPNINNSDVVTYIKVNSVKDISVGDIVLYRYFHRVISINDSANPVRCLTKGDNNKFPDDWFDCKNINWKVVCINGFTPKT